MASTTGSTVLGLVQGLNRQQPQVSTAGSVFNLPEMTFVLGNPNNVVTSPVVSGLAYDPVNKKMYMAKTANGSTWFSVGSTT